MTSSLFCFFHIHLVAARILFPLPSESTFPGFDNLCPIHCQSVCKRFRLLQRILFYCFVRPSIAENRLLSLFLYSEGWLQQSSFDSMKNSCFLSAGKNSAVFAYMLNVRLTIILCVSFIASVSELRAQLICTLTQWAKDIFNEKRKKTLNHRAIGLFILFCSFVKIRN